jgi:hypothetical protein
MSAYIVVDGVDLNLLDFAYANHAKRGHRYQISGVWEPYLH